MLEDEFLAAYTGQLHGNILYLSVCLFNYCIIMCVSTIFMGVYVYLCAC